MPKNPSKQIVHILNGPNLNLLGTREPDIYGTQTLQDIENLCRARAKTLGVGLEFEQTNSEGAIVDQIQLALKQADGLIINPGAYTHTSIAIHDALAALSIPKIEVHLSNIHARESFRRHSYISPACDGMICGLGAHGYELALEGVNKLIQQKVST